MQIIVQQLFVSYYRDQDTHDEGLVFSPMPVVFPVPTDDLSGAGGGPRNNTELPAGWDGYIPPPRYRRVISWKRLQECIDSLYAEAKRLVERGAHGLARDGDQLDQKALELGMEVLPNCGLFGILTRGAHPQLSTVNDFAAHIPWEAIQERYMICPQGDSTVRVMQEEAGYCRTHGTPLKFVVNRISVTYHLSHLVHDQQPPIPKGKEFLFIEDPLEDLCSPTFDPQGKCRAHLETLRANLAEKGFRISRLAGEFATSQAIQQLIRRENVVGIYYFGHGLYDRSKDQGCLRLADGPIFAGEITSLNPAISFVFLNGCYSAMPGSDWTVEKKGPRNVAEAFAHGARVVIAPIFPILNVDAATFAETVFQTALTGAPLGEAVMGARRNSLARYEAQNRPDTCWMAYRFLGNPNRTLPIPQDSILGPIVTAETVAPRVFDDNGEFKPELFAFAGEEVFARAGRRRAWQNRTLVSVRDLIAGLLRKGELTRTLMRRSHIDPDKLYEQLRKTQEDDPPGTTPKSEPVTETPDDDSKLTTFEALLNRYEEQLKKLVERGTIRSRDECTKELVDVLIQADESAQREKGGTTSLISEKNVLESLLDGGCWRSDEVEGLPSAGRIKGYLPDLLRAGPLDDNGLVRLENLDKGARRVIDAAHSLSQQRGAYPIPNRLLLAAFLADEEGYATHLLEDYGQDPKVHLGILLESVTNHHSLTFGLGMEACARAVLPLLAHCRKVFGPDEPISEQALFRAFCTIMPDSLKQSFRKGPFPVDIDYLKRLEPLPPILVPGNFDETGWAIVCRAGECAWKEGSSKIRTSHLLAGLALEERDRVGKYLRSHGLDPAQVLRLLTKVETGAGAPAPSAPGLRPSFNARSMLVRAIRVARDVRGNQAATAEDIFYASMTDWDMLVGSVKGIRQ